MEKNQAKKQQNFAFNRLFPVLRAFKDKMFDLCDTYCIGFFSMECKNNPDRKKCNARVIIKDAIELQKHINQAKNQRELT